MYDLQSLFALNTQHAIFLQHGPGMFPVSEISIIKSHNTKAMPLFSRYHDLLSSFHILTTSLSSITSEI